MAFIKIENIIISGISAAVPKKKKLLITTVNFLLPQVYLKEE